MSEPAAVEPTPTEPAQAADWEGAFTGLTPAEVKEALENSRKWEARAKANKAAADKLTELEESKKSETQKLQEQLAQFQERASQAERDRERLSVIAKHGIPEEYHDLVHGTDADSLEASAAKVKALIASNAAPAQEATFIIPSEGGSPNLALNGDGIESALKNALGIR